MKIYIIYHYYEQYGVSNYYEDIIIIITFRLFHVFFLIFDNGGRHAGILFQCLNFRLVRVNNERLSVTFIFRFLDFCFLRFLRDYFFFADVRYFTPTLHKARTSSSVTFWIGHISQESVVRCFTIALRNSRAFSRTLTILICYTSQGSTGRCFITTLRSSGTSPS